ncbi:hypothetical protein MHLP_03255 [Candidatus Mycoplasma haematolamae str. Purdue]|uniref:Uncharacterized protein n=1 Tax=Mycoplasma haematolamae (strain Purdue) TaxID=1212765 RepID=I7CG61_MYCHA|nr:hypothetical protein [Candidatus Mycoplasma haematolamae]AFO52231.1 hypothetical protein MHLP_03255 [Candidatus Mycoplasma haematolamae str. Purdue]
MFTFAKFVSSALGFLTVGSTGAFVAPVALTDSLYGARHKTKRHLDLDGFKRFEKELKAQLDLLGKKWELALRATKFARDKKFEKIQEIFTQVSESEGQLKKKYEELLEKISKISDLLKQESLESTKKLYVQSASTLLQTYEAHYKTISEHFEKQRKAVLEIVCVIDKTRESAQSQTQAQPSTSEQTCATEDWIKKLEESPQSSSPPSAGGASTSQAQGETASQQALKSLSGVREALYGMSKEVKNYTQKLDESKEEAKRAREFLTQYISFVESLVKLLQDYQSRLKKGIESDTQESSEIVKKINKFNEEIVRTNKDWEELKSQFIVLKAYEGKIVNSLCSLQTIEKPNCITQDAVEVL